MRAKSWSKTLSTTNRLNEWINEMRLRLYRSAAPPPPHPMIHFVDRKKELPFNCDCVQRIQCDAIEWRGDEEGRRANSQFPLILVCRESRDQNIDVCLLRATHLSMLFNPFIFESALSKFFSTFSTIYSHPIHSRLVSNTQTHTQHTNEWMAARVLFAFNVLNVIFLLTAVVYQHSMPCLAVCFVQCSLTAHDHMWCKSRPDRAKHGKKREWEKIKLKRNGANGKN